MGTKAQNAALKNHLGSSCRTCGKKVRFQVMTGKYTKCGCGKKPKLLSLTMKDRQVMSKVTRAMEPIKGFNTLRLRKWPKQKRRDIAK